MKFKFSLEKVLKHRKIQVDLAQRDFLEAQAAYNNALADRDAMIEAKTQNAADRNRIIQAETNWQFKVEQINVFLKGQDVRIALQNKRLLELEKVVESRREILRVALTEARIIESLREKKKAEFIKDFLDKEQKELDDIASTRYARIEKE